MTDAKSFLIKPVTKLCRDSGYVRIWFHQDWMEKEQKVDENLHTKLKELCKTNPMLIICNRKFVEKQKSDQFAIGQNQSQSGLSFSTAAQENLKTNLSTSQNFKNSTNSTTVSSQ